MHNTHNDKYTHTYQMGTYIKGHFTFPAFCLSLSFALFRPSASPSLQLPQSLFLSLFLSVKVMQLIFLCLFIFQDWLWNVGSRQKPLCPPFPQLHPLSSPPPSFPLCWPSSIPKPSDKREYGGMQPPLSLPLLSGLLSLSATSWTTFH